MWTKNIEKASIALQLLRKIDEGAKTHEETKAEVSCRDHHCPAGPGRLHNLSVVADGCLVQTLVWRFVEEAT